MLIEPVGAALRCLVVAMDDPERLPVEIADVHLTTTGPAPLGEIVAGTQAVTVFPVARPLGRVELTFTPEADTAVARLRGSVALDFDVWIGAGDFDDARLFVERSLDRLDAIAVAGNWGVGV